MRVFLEGVFYEALSWVCTSFPQAPKCSMPAPGTDQTLLQLWIHFSILSLDWELSQSGYCLIYSLISWFPKLAHHLAQSVCIT